MDLVPVGRQTQDGPGITGAQRADDQVMNFGRVDSGLHVLALGPCPLGHETHLCDRGHGVVAQKLLELGIEPGTCNELGSVVQTGRTSFDLISLFLARIDQLSFVPFLSLCLLSWMIRLFLFQNQAARSISTRLD
jgi:hypothetical protein